MHRMTEGAENMGPGPLQAPIFKIKGTRAVHFRQNQAAESSHESILGCHTLECSAVLHGTGGSAHQRSFPLVFTGSRLGQWILQRDPNKMLSWQRPPSAPLTGALRVTEWRDLVLWFLEFGAQLKLTLLCPGQGF